MGWETLMALNTPAMGRCPSRRACMRSQYRARARCNMCSAVCHGRGRCQSTDEDGEACRSVISFMRNDDRHRATEHKQALVHGPEQALARASTAAGGQSRVRPARRPACGGWCRQRGTTGTQGVGAMSTTPRGKEVACGQHGKVTAAASRLKHCGPCTVVSKAQNLALSRRARGPGPHRGSRRSCAWQCSCRHCPAATTAQDHRPPAACRRGARAPVLVSRPRCS